MPEPDFLRDTRDGYNATATAYAEAFHDHLRDKPIDRAMLSAFLSANMINEARRLNPGLPFDVGSMTDLPYPAGHCGGVCAWYSTIHIPEAMLPQVFSEFHRVLRPGGGALLAFQVGDRPRVLEDAFGQRVALTFHRRRPDVVERLLADAGLRPYTRLMREPDDDVESTPQAYLIVRKLP
nr:methyltransferase domain-containing protein [Mycolicibacterium komanii]CRL78230.1 methyltransferase [Mycolicibacterium komanii]